MGLLRDWNFEKINCQVYVETGTGLGVSLSKAYRYFKKCYSVDLDEEMVNSARDRFPNANVEIGRSIDLLEKWLTSGELSQDDNVFFYLDAHFPNADFRNAPYDVFSADAVPLKEELELIKKYRPKARDLILCDDARIYMTGPFENGNVEWLQVPGGLNFLKDLFEPSCISILFAEEGYILIDQSKRISI